MAQTPWRRPSKGHSFRKGFPHVAIYIYIEREREREIHTDTYIVSDAESDILVENKKQATRANKYGNT